LSWPCGQQSWLKSRRRPTTHYATRPDCSEANGIDCGASRAGGAPPRECSLVRIVQPLGGSGAGPRGKRHAPRQLFAVDAERGEIGPGVDAVPGAAAESWAEQRTDRIGAVRDHWNIASLEMLGEPLRRLLAAPAALRI
jgi:hypothetical protein